jgi:uncharacterized protein (TIGR03083 family)
MTMDGPPDEITPLFLTERARLSELLAGLAPADWRRPTPCPGWTVLDLCAHLAGDDLSFLARHRDGHYGTPGPEHASEEEFVRWLDGLQAGWVAAARKLSPRLVLDLLAWSGPQVAETLRGEDPRARTASVSWAGTGPVPTWLDQVRELSEYWIHRQQLLQALDRPSDLRDDLAGPVLDGLRWAYPFRLGQAARSEPGDTVTVSVSGPVARTWFLVAGPSGWEFRDERGRRGVAALSLTTEQAWRLLSNNLPAAERSRITAAGDAAVLDILYRTRAIIGIPRLEADPARAEEDFELYRAECRPSMRHWTARSWMTRSRSGSRPPRCGGFGSTSWRSTRATTGTPTCSARPSTAQSGDRARSTATVSTQIKFLRALAMGRRPATSPSTLNITVVELMGDRAERHDSR